MFKFLFNNNKGEEDMARAKTSKTTKIRNLFETGVDVSWKTLRNNHQLQWLVN